MNMTKAQEFELLRDAIIAKTGWSYRALAKRAGLTHPTILAAGKHIPHDSSLEVMREIWEEVKL